MTKFPLLTLIAGMLSYVKFKKDRLRLKKLISNGLKVGKNVYIMEDVEFDLNYPFLIQIGDNCRISKDVRILAHDATTFREIGITRLASVKILEGTFIGERAIILPGVTIGPKALIAAGSVVNRDIGKGKAVAGNPARPYGNYSNILQKYSEIARTSTIIDKKDFESGLVSFNDMVSALEKDSIAFVRGVPKHDHYYINTDMNIIRDKAVKAFNDNIASSCTEKSEKSFVHKTKLPSNVRKH